MLIYPTHTLSFAPLFKDTLECHVNDDASTGEDNS